MHNLNCDDGIALCTLLPRFVSSPFYTSTSHCSAAHKRETPFGGGVHSRTRRKTSLCCDDAGRNRRRTDRSTGRRLRSPAEFRSLASLIADQGGGDVFVAGHRKVRPRFRTFNGLLFLSGSFFVYSFQV